MVSLRHASDYIGAYLMFELCDTLRHAPSSSMAEVAHTCRELAILSAGVGWTVGDSGEKARFWACAVEKTLAPRSSDGIVAFGV